MLRQLAAGEFPAAADYLDSRTMVLRWLVAALRGGGIGPEDSPWGFHGITAAGAGPGGDLRGVIAHFWPAATLYICGDADMDLEAVEVLCEEELLPERLVGDRAALDAWEGASGGLFEDPVRVSELDVLAYRGGDDVPAGFRRAEPGEAGLLEEYARLLYLEVGEEEAALPGVESLIERGLVFVFEKESRTQGMVFSNLSDGRYVHGGGVFVHPAYRGAGVGRLLAEGLGAAVRRELGVTAVLDVYRENAAASAAYRGAGYERVGEGRIVRLRRDAWA